MVNEEKLLGFERKLFRKINGPTGAQYRHEKI